MSGDVLDVKEWRRRAEQDKSAIAAVIKLEEPLWEIAGFHAQQLGEKYLKAFLIQNGWSLRKMHDLKELLSDAVEFDASLAPLSGDCALLTPFAMAGRYPNASWFSRSTCEAAIAAAERIRAEILKRLA